MQKSSPTLKLKTSPTSKRCVKLEKMQLALGVLSVLSLLAASIDAQSCRRLTGDDLGTTEMPTSDGLISRRLTSKSSMPVLVRLFRFQIVCEVTAQSENRYRHVSVVAEYSADTVANTSSQFEFTCLFPDDAWTLITNRPVDNTVATPPDATLDTQLRSDCLNCLSPDRAGSNAQGVNHCEGNPLIVQKGQTLSLIQCIIISTCSMPFCVCWTETVLRLKPISDLLQLL